MPGMNLCNGPIMEFKRMFHYVISVAGKFGDMLSRTKLVTYYDIWLTTLIKTTERFAQQ
jgi:hypothetical protein